MSFLLLEDDPLATLEEALAFIDACEESNDSNSSGNSSGTASTVSSSSSDEDASSPVQSTPSLRVFIRKTASGPLEPQRQVHQPPPQRLLNQHLQPRLCNVLPTQMVTNRAKSVKKHRERKKTELLMLREQATLLEKRLAHCQRITSYRQSRSLSERMATSRTLQITNERGAASDSSSERAASWPEMAVQQARERFESEALNLRLRDTLVRQAQLTKSLEVALSQTKAEGFELLLDHLKQGPLGHKNQEPANSTVSVGVKHLHLDLQQMYLTADSVVGPQSEVDWSGAAMSSLTHVKPKELLAGKCIEVKTSTLLHCSFQDAGRAMWQRMSNQQQKQQRYDAASAEGSAMEFVVQKHERTNEGFEKCYDLVLNLPGHQQQAVELHGMSYMHKFDEVDRYLIVWTSAVALSNDGPQLTERGWIVAWPSVRLSSSSQVNVAESSPSTVVKTCYQVSCVPQSLGVLPQTQERMVLVLRTLSRRTREYQQLMQSMLLDEFCGSTSQPPPASEATASPTSALVKHYRASCLSQLVIAPGIARQRKTATCSASADIVPWYSLGSFVHRRRMPSSITTKRITRSQLIHIIRRLLVLVGIFLYIAISLRASIRSLAVLRGAQSPTTTYSSAKATLILDYVGSERIRDSKLVKQVLQGDTTPRNDMLYLNSPTETSFLGCSSSVAPKFDPYVYNNAFLRYGFNALTTTGAYNITYLADYNLIVPFVDCTFDPLIEGDKSHARLFYLLRRNAQDTDVAILTVSMAVQNYETPVQHEEGSGLVATFTLIDDMRVAPVTHHFAVSLGYPFDPMPTFEIYTYLGESNLSEWILESIPRDPYTEQTKVMYTAMRRGLFLRAAAIQSNIKYLLPTLSNDPASVLSVWTWRGKTILRDSWAWVHYVHIVFAFSTLFNQLVLFLVMYRNFQLGKIWIGDAFASVSKSLVLRGTIVLISWHFNEYWTLTEICFAGGYDIAKLPKFFIYSDIAQADLLTLYLCSVDFLGFMTKTRIDPAFAILAFMIGFYARIQISHLFPSAIQDWFKNYTVNLHESGITSVGDILARLSPMRLWTSARVPKSNLLFIVASGFAIFLLTYGAAVCYVVIRKVDQRRHPDRYKTRRHARSSAETKVTAQSTSATASEDDLTYKRSLTLFEIATGAELQNRFGLLSDYDNFVYFKGLKFASADGIYCNGFVIANGKFLIATEDIFTIILMKVLRSRLRNVYTYEVDGSKLKQTAQLVYPGTLTWYDLLHINVGILS